MAFILILPLISHIYFFLKLFYINHNNYNDKKKCQLYKSYKLKNYANKLSFIKTNILKLSLMYFAKAFGYV